MVINGTFYIDKKLTMWRKLQVSLFKHNIKWCYCPQKKYFYPWIFGQKYNRI